MQKKGIMFLRKRFNKLNFSIFFNGAPWNGKKTGIIHRKNVLLPAGFAGVSEASVKRLWFLSLK
jgi:hypothetical protein